MPRKKSPLNNPPTRPLIKIDWDMVDHYLMAACNGSEIAALLGCSADTLYNRCAQEKGVTFTAYAQEKKQKGDSILRAAQYKKAIKGDNTMMVWLGKNRLNQKDRETTDIPQNDKKLDQLIEDIKSLKDHNMIDNTHLNIPS